MCRETVRNKTLSPRCWVLAFWIQTETLYPEREGAVPGVESHVSFGMGERRAKGRAEPSVASTGG